MMAVLVAELGIRRVEKKDHIIILSEWDTFYGRSMPDTFKNAWKSSEKDEQPVQAYGYMRGLDGKLPDKDDKTDSSADKKADNKDKSATNAKIELPEGQNQKDYLRRLADSLRDLDQYLIKTDANKKGIAAIGVLGSDVHDKLMILEALRQYFPHKLFFTTDLDAAYSHPAKWPQTHNLLVASGFDLKLRAELQGNIPSFRDSYQTAFFLATQLILKNTSDSANPITIQPPARLFEIGRSHSLSLPTVNDTPVLSTASNNNNGVKCAWTNWSACNNRVQPELFATSPINLKWPDFYVTVMIVFLLVLISWRVRETVTRILKYTAADGSIFKLGDTLVIGTPSGTITNTTAAGAGNTFGLGKAKSRSKSNFQTIIMGRPAGVSSIMSAMAGEAPQNADASMQGEIVIIAEMKVAHKGSKKKPLELIILLGEPNGRAFGMNKYMSVVDYEKSVLAGEIRSINAPLNRDEAIAKLKESKDLMDLGVIDVAAYEKIKAELTPIILNKG